VGDKNNTGFWLEVWSSAPNFIFRRLGILLLVVVPQISGPELLISGFGRVRPILEYPANINRQDPIDSRLLIA
jgi:hypothetical protein